MKIFHTITVTALPILFAVITAHAQSVPQPPSGLRIGTPIWEGCRNEVLLGAGSYAAPAECSNGQVPLQDHPDWGLLLVDDFGVSIPGEQYPAVRYAENVGGSRELAVAVDQRGYPELRLAGSDGVVQYARSPQPLGSRLSVTQVATAPYAESYTKVTLTVGTHNFAIGDTIWVRNFGLPFDGSQIITDLTSATLTFLVPQSAPSFTSRGGRRLPGYFSSQDWNGEPIVHGVNRSFQSRPLNYLRRVLTTPWSATSWSIAGWVKLHSTETATAALTGIFGGYDIFKTKPARAPSIDVRNTGQYEIHPGVGNPVAIGPAVLNQWVHIAAVRNGSQITVYYNGSLVSTNSLSSTEATVFGELGFGFGTLPTAQAPVDLDDWGFFPGQALALSEIAVLYGGGSGTAYESLPTALKNKVAAWYGFDEAYGNITDSHAPTIQLTEVGLLPWVSGKRTTPFTPDAAQQEVIGTNVYVWELGATFARRLVLTVTKQGSQVTFYRDGEPLGTAPLRPMTALPPLSASTVGSTGRGQGVTKALAIIGALSAQEVDEISLPNELVFSRTEGIVPLAVNIDASNVGGLPRQYLQDATFQFTFLHSDDEPLDTTGRAYNRPTGFFVNHTYNTPGEYLVHLSVRKPQHNTAGQLEPEEVLHSAIIGKVTATDWPATTMTYYVGGSDPRASDSNTGLSPETPLKTLQRARAFALGPHKRILFKRGETFDLHTSSWQIANVQGPAEIGAYGDTALPRPIIQKNPAHTIHISLHQNNNVRVRDLHLKNTTFSISGAHSHPLFYSLELENHGCFYAPSFSNTRHFTADKITMSGPSGGGGYYFYLSGPHYNTTVSRMSATRFGGFHVLRSHQSHNLHITGYDVRSYDHSSSTYFTCATPRWQSRNISVTDTRCADYWPFGFSASARNQYEVGPQRVLIERSRLAAVTPSYNSATLRYNAIYRSGYDAFDIKASARQMLGDPQFLRTYRNRFAGQIRASGHTSHLRTENEIFSGYDTFMGSTQPLLPPQAALLQIRGGTVDLGVHRGATGGRGLHTYQWQRSSDGGQSWADIPGARTASLVEIAIPRGTYRYRVQLSDENSATAPVFSNTVSATVD